MAKDEEITSDERIKNLKKEIVSVSQAREIIKQTILDRQADKNVVGKDEEVPDYIGNAGKALKELIETGIKKGKEWMPKSRTANNSVKDSMISAATPIGGDDVGLATETKKSAKKVVFTGIKGAATGLNKARESALNIHTGLENRKEKLNQILQNPEEQVNDQKNLDTKSDEGR